MKKNKYTLILILLFTLISCGPAYIKPFGPVFTYSKINEISNMDPNNVILVIYKYGINATDFYAGNNVEIEIDKINIGDLDEKTYIIKKIPAGTHEIRAIVPFMQRPTNAMLKFKTKIINQEFVEGEIYYINYNIDAEPIGERFVYLSVGQAFNEADQKTNSVNFTVVEKNIALSELSKCKENIEFD